MNSISVVIITLNEEKNLPRCLESVQSIADEIIVVDSYSEDRTAEIARSYGARVYLHPFEGYGSQKNIAANYASHEWIFSIDADEAVSPELAESILKIKKKPDAGIYECNRLTNYCGQWIRHCGWYPDRLIRLWKRDQAVITPEWVHESIRATDPTARVRRMHGDLLHYSYTSVSEHLKKIEHYSRIGAQNDAGKGKRAGLLKVWLLPKWIFFTIYILRLGFLDGFYGYVISRNSAFAAYSKYLQLRELNRTSE